MDLFECKNFNQLVKKLEDIGAKKKLVICKIKINDRFVDEEEEQLLHKMSLKTVNQIEVHYSSSKDLIKSTMVNIVKLIDTTVSMCYSLADIEIKTEDFPNQLGGVIRNGQLMIESLREVYNLNMRAHVLKHLALWKNSESEIEQVLQIVITLFEHKKWNEMQDILKYDLPEALLMWQDTLETELYSK